LQSIKAVNGANTVLQDLVYDYTDDGGDTELLQKVTDNKAANITAYTYDGLHRLDTAITTGATPSSYDYDLTKGGNRTRVVFSDPGQTTATTRTYGYNAANQLTSIDGSTAGLTYDANGNQTQNPTIGTLAHNARDQITGITPLGSTTRSTLVHAGPGQNDLLSAGGATLQNDALGLASKTTGTSTTSYVRDNAGKVISQLNGTNRRYWLTDERGSLIAATDSDGKITSAYKFDPYGRPIGSPHDTLGYAGGIRIPTGLVHFGARYYNPEDGRWTQQDPINQAGDLREANRYG